MATEPIYRSNVANDGMPTVVGSTPQQQPRYGFVRAVLLLSGAGALAHGITAVAMPVLSRLYAPEDFGQLSVLTSCLGVLGAAACLRYDLAIPLPHDSRDANDLLALSLTVCTALSALAALVILCMPEQFAGLLGQPGFAPFLWLVPFGLWLTGCYAALQIWHVRQAAFPRMARTRIVQSATTAGLQIGAGSMSIGAGGLLMGPIWNAGVGTLALLPPAWQGLRRASWANIGRLAALHRRFPLYSTPEALANSAALHLPVIVIAAYAGVAEVGFLGMAMFVAQAPMSLIGTSISQVFLSRAAEEHRNGQLGAFTGDVLDGLVKSGVGPLLALGILAPVLCGWLFGHGWARTGWLVSWMTPWFLAQFLVVPLSMTLHICGRQRRAMLLQLAGLVLRLGSVWALAAFGTTTLSEVYALTGFLFYGLYLAVVLRAAGVPLRQLGQASRRHAGLIATWAAAAAAASLLAHALASGN